MINFFNALKKLQANAYNPYSHFPVSCIVIDEKGKEFYGVNVENSSYGLSICAERSAITNMITCGSKKIKAIHILCGDESFKGFASACGACRQVINEFIGSDGKIYLWNHNKEYKVFSIDDYLVDSFTASKLKGA